METCDVLIVEDEIVIAEAIADILTHSGFTNIRITDSVEEALNEMERRKPGIVLTDINLGREKTGIDLGHQLLHRYRIPFIYITSYSSPEIVGKAKHTFPSAYILKPFKNEDLLVAIELALFNSHNRYIAGPGDPVLSIKDGRAMTNVAFRNIAWIEATGSFTTVNASNGKRKVVKDTLNHIEKQFGKKQFLRIHEAYLVNANYITETRPASVVVNGHELPIGKDYQDSVSAFFHC
jgi:two-component system, LytTR family, response regulator LytT